MASTKFDERPQVVQEDRKIVRRMIDQHGHEDMHLNFGPQHPSTHGVINFLVDTDGEVISRAIPDVGYLHRSIEKIGEKCTYPGFMPYTDRADYLAAMFANQGYAMAVEKITGIEVPARGEYCRVISCELNRIASHLVSIGTMAMDVGAVTPFPYALREREYINDLIEELCGARLTYNYHRIGGVAWDLPDGWAEKCLRYLDHFDPIVDEWDRLITGNWIMVKRLAGVATITAAQAIDFGLVGPNLRGSGVDWDLRRDMPYSTYKDFEFDVPIGRVYAKEMGGELGDAYDRFVCRVEEMRQSSRIVRQAVQKLPAGPVMAKVPRKIKPENGAEAYVRIESARGEMGYYVVSDGTESPYRCRIRTGSFCAMGIIDPLSPGLMIADLVALIASLDVVAPEIDR